MNIYDNKEFFDSYRQMSRSKGGLESAGEWYVMKNLYTSFDGKTVLDLGCGYGWHCKYAADNGAAAVTGVDGSRRMIEKACRINSHTNITYITESIENFDYGTDCWDVVVSNLALHYIENLDNIYTKVYKALKKGGYFVFNIEHPVFTAGVNQQWVTDENGKNLYWPVDNYYYPGERVTDFLGYEVKKYHHTMTQIVNGLIKAGFTLTDLYETGPAPETLDNPYMLDEMRRPMMLIVKAVK